jgi:hypothetical protein
VCQLLYIIIFVPYNLFKLFLVHKISAYKYIYENGKNKWEKEKEKEFSASWAGGISAQPSAGAGGAGGPAGPREPETARRTPWARAHAPERGKERWRQGGGGRSAAGENRSSVIPTVVPRRWSGFEWMEWWQSTSGGRGSRRWSQFGRWMPGVAVPRWVAGSTAVRPPVRPMGGKMRGENDVSCSG